MMENIIVVLSPPTKKKLIQAILLVTAAAVANAILVSGCIQSSIHVYVDRCRRSFAFLLNKISLFIDYMSTTSDAQFSGEWIPVQLACVFCCN